MLLYSFVIVLAAEHWPTGRLAFVGGYFLVIVDDCNVLRCSGRFTSKLLTTSSILLDWAVLLVCQTLMADFFVFAGKLSVLFNRHKRLVDEDDESEEAEVEVDDQVVRGQVAGLGLNRSYQRF